MKKILIVAVMLTGLSFASFADEVKQEENQKTSKNEKSKSDGVYCIAGLTTCGETYMHCDDTPFGDDEEFIIYLLEDQARCGG